MKERYEEPVLEVIELSNQDIVTLSNVSGGGYVGGCDGVDALTP